MSTITATRPRLGFVGVGWIGRQRLDALARSGRVEIAGALDPVLSDDEPFARFNSLHDLLEAEVDGVVIGTPNALHAEQVVAALESGRAVFCQKPLGLTAAETQRAVEAARRANRLLAVDLCYRHLDAVQRLREEQIGEVFAADLTFHNAYGPDKAWFWEPSLSGGGCLIDLGSHLVDLALWWLGYPRVREVAAHLHGEPIETYAAAQLLVETGSLVRLACSWRLHAGQDCAFEASFYGTDGSASIRNVNGSFYDFVGELRRGSGREVVSTPPDDWSARAVVEWARRLAEGVGFDPEAERLVEAASVIDAVYGRASCES
jgi:predicted dehydrogenase